jgi:ribonucleotide reductase beta subunit family protein with ferritin-like domain
MKNKLKPERIQEIIMEAVTIEKKFISESLPSDLIGINSKVMFD